MKHKTLSGYVQLSLDLMAEQLLDDAKNQGDAPAPVIWGMPGQHICALFNSDTQSHVKIVNRLPPPVARLMRRTGLTPERLLALAAQSEARLYQIGLDISYFGGAQVKLTCWKSKPNGGRNGEAVPEITIRRGKGGWYLHEIHLVGNLVLADEWNELWLTPRQHAYLTYRLNVQYTVYRPGTMTRVRRNIEQFNPFTRY